MFRYGLLAGCRIEKHVFEQTLAAFAICVETCCTTKPTTPRHSSTHFAKDFMYVHDLKAPERLTQKQSTAVHIPKFWLEIA